MSDCYKEKDILNFILSHFVKAECDLCKVNMVQVHSLINILVEANIPFSMSYNEGTPAAAKNISFTINISPTITINKLFQLQEGDLT